MENKYYAPTIEEFRVGFEYEYTNDNGGTWSNYVMTPVDLRRHPYELTGSDRLRVKYLDREDIESLGGVKWPDDDIYDLGEFQLHLGRHNDPYKVEIYDENDQYCFVGVIKNKSELKNILKMIGYE